MSAHRKSDGTTTITGADGKISNNIASGSLGGPGLPPPPITRRAGDPTTEDLCARIENLTQRLAVEQAYADNTPGATGSRVAEVQRTIEYEQRKLAYLQHRSSFGIPEDAEDCHLSGRHRKDWFAKEKLVRNPDGSTNVWVRTVTDDGTTTYLPVIGVEVVEDLHRNTGNALVTSDGAKHFEWGYWENGHPVRHDVAITVAPAAVDASPLINEGDPDAAFHLPSQ